MLNWLPTSSQRFVEVPGGHRRSLKAVGPEIAVHFNKSSMCLTYKTYFLHQTGSDPTDLDDC